MTTTYQKLIQCIEDLIDKYQSCEIINDVKLRFIFNGASVYITIENKKRPLYSQFILKEYELYE